MSPKLNSYDYCKIYKYIFIPNIVMQNVLNCGTSTDEITDKGVLMVLTDKNVHSSNQNVANPNMQN